MRVGSEPKRTRLRTVDARTERYRRYATEKARIPVNLNPYEYEQEIIRLSRKYKI